MDVDGGGHLVWRWGGLQWGRDTQCRMQIKQICQVTDLYCLHPLLVVVDDLLELRPLLHHIFVILEPIVLDKECSLQDAVLVKQAS